MKLTQYSGSLELLIFGLRYDGSATIQEVERPVCGLRNHMVKIPSIDQIRFDPDARRNGGVRLARPPESISVEAFRNRDHFDLVECGPDNHCHYVCASSGVLTQPAKHFKLLRKTSLADLVKSGKTLEKSLLPPETSSGFIRDPAPSEAQNQVTKWPPGLSAITNPYRSWEFQHNGIPCRRATSSCFSAAR